MSERVVHKYPIPPGGLGLTLELPASSVFAHFAEQHGVLTIWIDRPLDNAEDELDFTFDYVIRGTGQPITDSPRLGGDGSWRHLASTLIDDGNYVFHLYGRSRL